MIEIREKHKQKFKESGITLIALVITIIVLLILAGVALATLTGDSGILSNSEKSKESTAKSNAKEQVELAVQGARVEGVGTITREDLKAELDNIVGEGKYSLSEGEETWTVTVGNYKATVSKNGNVIKTRDIETLPSAEGTTPWLPEGFSQVIGTTLDNGLTISNATGTQNYVWIEVPTTEQTITLSDGTTKTINLAEATTEEEIIENLELYAGKGTNQDYTYSTTEHKDEWYDSNGKTAGTDGVDLEDDRGCGMTYSQYQTAYSNMLSSIKTYGGFWLAQYEAGIAYEEDGATTNRTSSSARITNPTSANYAKDQYAYNWVYCSEAQKIANADTTNEYTSSLPFGIQWDLVCKFLEVKTDLEYTDIATNSTWGNYHETFYTPNSTARYSINDGSSFSLVSTYKKESRSAVLLTTGAIEATTVSADSSPMNIYDLAGNVSEWTLEQIFERWTTNPSVKRDWSYVNRGGAPVSISERISASVTNAAFNIGFRSVLY